MILSDDQRINFKLNQNNSTAKVIFSPKTKDKILIPRSVEYNSQEFIVKSIDDESFKRNYSIKSISFANNSELQSIGQKSFALSYIQTLYIPSTVKELKIGWCCQTQYLNQVIISPKNEFFKYLDDANQIIIGRSDSKIDNYDTIVFASRNIQKVYIPPTIKYINSYAFSFCKRLQTIEFSKDSQMLIFGEYSFSYCFLKSMYVPSNVVELRKGWCRGNYKLQNIVISPQNKNFKFLDEKKEIIVGKSDNKSDIYDTIYFANKNLEHATIPSKIKYFFPFAFSECKSLHSIEFSMNSQLLSIGEGSFSSSNIESISIPSSTQIIDKYAFFNCHNLRKVEIQKNSQLKIIGKKAFSVSSLSYLFIPSTIKELQNGWNCDLTKLTNISISSDNENYKYIDKDEKIIVGKSKENDEDFDVLVLCHHDAVDPSIPSSIKHINSYAFSFCYNIQTIEFSIHSELVSIGKWSFFASSIESITIPSNVTKISKCTFFRCMNLKSVNFQNNSKLIEIEDDAFYNSSIERLSFPANVRSLQENWCNEIYHLNEISISPDNKYFKYLDSSHQMIVGKSKPSSDVYDVLIFACRKIEKAFIPSTIKYINSFCFTNCTRLKHIDFEPKSSLNSIGNWCFNSSSIENIAVPSLLAFSKNAVFGNCFNLKSIEFLGEIVTIGNYYFDCCRKLMLISAPNCNKVTILEKSFFLLSNDFFLFTVHDSIIELIKE